MGTDNKKDMGSATIRSFVMGALLSGLFAWITVIRDNPAQATGKNTFLAANMIPVLPYLFLFLAGILINPFLRRVKIARLFSKAELLLIFAMCAVSSGIASWGLSGKLVPVVSGVSNKAWNTDQSQWDVSVMPFLNENYFITAEGSQAAAKQLREVHLQHEQARKLYQRARDLELGRAEMARVENDIKGVAAIEDPQERAAKEQAAKWPYVQALKMLNHAEEEWNKIGADLNPETVVATYPERIETLKTERDMLREELKTLNKSTFESVETIRKGLPPEKRAIPGFFYSSGEGLASYMARIKRLKKGTQSLAILKQAREELFETIENNAPLPPDWSANLIKAGSMLEDISKITALSKLSDKLSTQLKNLEDEIAQKDVEIRRLRHLRRYSEQNQFETYNTRIDEVSDSTGDLKKQADEIRARLELQITPLLAVCERVKTTQNSIARIAENAQTEPHPALMEKLNSAISAYPSFDASYRRFWLGDVKWKIWIKPIFNWLLIIFTTYLVLMSFNTLIFRQWSTNEKLIYPLAEIPTLIAAGADPKAAPKPLLRSGLFWIGFTISAGILGWNYLAKNNIIPNINPVELQFLWINYVGGGIFKGLASTYFCIIFAVIGIAFLVPSGISFSLWFFEILYMCLLLVMVWLGYGSNRWSLGNVGRSGLGSGAMLVFGLAILWTCRHYLLCVFKPASLKGLDADEAKELKVSSALFLGGSLTLILMLTLGLGASPLMVIIFLLVAMTMIIAIIRAVAEGGILGLESHASVLGIIKTTIGMSKSWCAPLLLAPIPIFNAFLFGSMKAMIAPMMANSLKIREQFRMRRLHFHIAIWTAIIAATAVSIITLIMLSYGRGADNLNGWMHSASARGVIEGVKGLVESTGQVKPSEHYWMLSGALLMGALLFFRQRIFGIPHPIGLLMLMNPNMFGFWGSIFIGWTFKSIVSKYCSHEQYVAVRRFFIGLVLGHLVAVLFGWDPLDFHWG